MLAARRGLLYRARGLRELPAAFADTALFAAGDGGHERDVLSGTTIIGDESVPLHIFTFAFQRDVRGETAILGLRPPFHLASPTTVIAYDLPRTFGHLLVKRTGSADDVPSALVDPPRTLIGVVREASTIDRFVRVDPPPRLPAPPLAADGLGGDYRAWGESPEQARAILATPVTGYLRSPAAGTGEWVIEFVDTLLIVYGASDGALSEERILAMNEFTDELCRRVMEATAPLSPRGVEHRP